jgi:TetR/AcrR family transcriptional repressor of mexJK operon
MTETKAVETPPLKPRSADKREEVLEIASEKFLKHGFDGTSINVMAREAGISKESIYRYFGSKEDLFMAVVERELLVYRKGMQETSNYYQGETMREALLIVAESTLKSASNTRTLALRRLVFQMSAHGSKAGSHYFLAGPDIAYKNLTQLFDYYKPESHFSVDELSRYFMSVVLHRTMLLRECGVQTELTDEEIKQQSATAIDAFIKAFCKRA